MNYEEIKSNLEVIKDFNIYFGHQSVGKNIIQGLEGILEELKFQNLNIVELDSPDNVPERYFAHSRIGANTNPEGKCAAFSELFNKKLLRNADIAFMKFCYVDIKEKTDVKSLFDYYEKTISSLKKNYPDTIFAHVTIPLMANSGGWKIKVKRLITYQDYTDPANIKRNKYNRLLINQYPNDSIFDLAKVESTRPNGKRESFKYKGQIYYSLVREYTYDGGHLNNVGRQKAAVELIQTIASAIKNSKKADTNPIKGER